MSIIWVGLGANQFMNPVHKYDHSKYIVVFNKYES